MYYNVTEISFIVYCSSIIMGLAREGIGIRVCIMMGIEQI